MEFKDILGHAFDLATQQIFTVHFVSNDNRENRNYYERVIKCL